MIVAVIDENTYQSYIGTAFYMYLTWIGFYGDWRLGTDAIRYLDNDYYADPRLYPSLFYLFGIMSHEYWEEEQNFENDPTAEEDVIIENEDDSVFEEESADEVENDQGEVVEPSEDLENEPQLEEDAEAVEDVEEVEEADDGGEDFVPLG